MANESTLPLQGELNLVKYLDEIFNGSALDNLKSSTVTAGQVKELSAADMQNLMTEYMRGSGNFLQNMQQQNIAGLYNTSTQKLVSNDILAQAALKATQANTQIKSANANLAQSALNTNAQLAQQLQLARLKAGGGTSKGQLAAAAGINLLNSLLGGKKGKAGTKGKTEETTSKDKNIFDSIKEAWDSMTNSSYSSEQLDALPALPETGNTSVDPGIEMVSLSDIVNNDYFGDGNADMNNYLDNWTPVETDYEQTPLEELYNPVDVPEHTAPEPSFDPTELTEEEYY